MSDPRQVELEQLRLAAQADDPAAAELALLRHFLLQLKRGDCWCGPSAGIYLSVDGEAWHTPLCLQLRDYFKAPPPI